MWKNVVKSHSFHILQLNTLVGFLYFKITLCKYASTWALLTCTLSLRKCHTVSLHCIVFLFSKLTIHPRVPYIRTQLFLILLCNHTQFGLLLNATILYWWILKSSLFTLLQTVTHYKDTTTYLFWKCLWWSLWSGSGDYIIIVTYLLGRKFSSLSYYTEQYSKTKRIPWTIPSGIYLTKIKRIKTKWLNRIPMMNPFAFLKAIFIYTWIWTKK